jgi:dTDP-4-amino-4,6-dideoxygalactose transaminase
VTSTCNLLLRGPDSGEAERALAEAGVETRRWWGDGAHLHPSTAGFPRRALPVTEMLAKSTISVPFYRDLDPAHIDTVSAVVRAVVNA